jgi:hypothetical protein
VYELYNEPDIDDCLTATNSSAAYLEHYMLRARAVRNCYQDMDAGGWGLILPACGRGPEQRGALCLHGFSGNATPLGGL